MQPAQLGTTVLENQKPLSPAQQAHTVRKENQSVRNVWLATTVINDLQLQQSVQLEHTLLLVLPRAVLARQGTIAQLDHPI